MCPYWVSSLRKGIILFLYPCLCPQTQHLAQWFTWYVLNECFLRLQNKHSNPDLIKIGLLLYGYTHQFEGWIGLVKCYCSFLNSLLQCLSIRLLWVDRCCGYPTVSGYTQNWLWMSTLLTHIHTRTHTHTLWGNEKIYCSHNKVFWTSVKNRALSQVDPKVVCESKGRRPILLLSWLGDWAGVSVPAHVGQAMLWFELLTSATGGHTQTFSTWPYVGQRGKGKVWKL